MFLVVIIASSVFSIVYLDRSYKENMKQILLNRAEVIESIMASRGEIDDIMYTIDDIMDMRVTVLDVTGKVLLDTRADAAQLENHIGRPEVREALESGSGVNIRYSETLGKDLMYAAVYSADQQLIIRVSMLLEGISEYSAELWVPLVTLLIVSFLLCLVISLFVSRSITRPIKQLKNETVKIARGEYSRIKPLRTGDEIEALSGALSEMTLALKRNIEDITEKNSRLQAVFRAVPGGILAVDNDEVVTMANPAAVKMFSISGAPEGKHFLEVTKHQKLESVIRDAMRANGVVEREITIIRGMEDIHLQVFAVSVGHKGAAYGVILLAQDITRIRKLENLRSDFAANVSHELKTPLTVISGFIDTLKDPDITKKDAARFLDIISMESERLTRLIDDVLLLSDIENAGGAPAARIDIRNGVREAAELLESKAAEKGVELITELPESQILVAADQDRIKQMVINLLDNAIKYTPSGGIVRTTLSMDAGRCKIRIQDTGIGIPRENLPRLFERFYRVDKSRSRALGGTGLGLAIVKHIVSLLGGHITVDSVVGEGTTFEVYLPAGSQ